MNLSVEQKLAINMKVARDNSFDPYWLIIKAVTAASGVEL